MTYTIKHYTKTATKDGYITKGKDGGIGVLTCDNSSKIMWSEHSWTDATTYNSKRIYFSFDTTACAYPDSVDLCFTTGNVVAVGEAFVEQIMNLNGGRNAIGATLTTGDWDWSGLDDVALAIGSIDFTDFFDQGASALHEKDDLSNVDTWLNPDGDTDFQLYHTQTGDEAECKAKIRTTEKTQSPPYLQINYEPDYTKILRHGKHVIDGFHGYWLLELDS